MFIFTQNEFFAGYKQAHRREDDIAIVNSGMKVTLDESNIVEHAAFAFGGMAPFTVMALKTMTGIVGRYSLLDIFSGFGFNRPNFLYYSVYLMVQQFSDLC